MAGFGLALSQTQNEFLQKQNILHKPFLVVRNRSAWADHFWHMDKIQRPLNLVTLNVLLNDLNQTLPHSKRVRLLTAQLGFMHVIYAHVAETVWSNPLTASKDGPRMPPPHHYTHTHNYTHTHATMQKGISVSTKALLLVLVMSCVMSTVF